MPKLLCLQRLLPIVVVGAAVACGGARHAEPVEPAFDPVGDDEFTAKLERGSAVSGTFTILGEPGDYQGVIRSQGSLEISDPAIPGGREAASYRAFPLISSMDRIEVEGNRLKFRAPTPNGDLHFALRLVGDALSGTWQLGSLFGVRGSMIGTKEAS